MSWTLSGGGAVAWGLLGLLLLTGHSSLWSRARVTKVPGFSAHQCPNWSLIPWMAFLNFSCVIQFSFPTTVYTVGIPACEAISKSMITQCLLAPLLMKRYFILISQWSLEARSSLTLWLSFPDSAKTLSQVVNSVKTNTLSAPDRALDLNNTAFFLQGNTSSL